jgi:hypothetical protein
MPNTIGYDPAKKRLLVGSGYVENVEAAVWEYEISGKKVLKQWFRSRQANREKPLIGDHRPPSPLSKIQPDHWLPEYTTELINVLNVLGRLVELEPVQAELLEAVCGGELISVDELSRAGVFDAPERNSRKSKQADMRLLEAMTGE